MKKKDKPESFIDVQMEDVGKVIIPHKYIREIMVETIDSLDKALGSRQKSIRTFLKDTQYQKERELFIGSLFILCIREFVKKEFLIRTALDEPADVFIYSEDENIGSWKGLQITEIPESIELSTDIPESAINQIEKTKFKAGYAQGDNISLLIWFNCKSIDEIVEPLRKWLKGRNDRYTEIWGFYFSEISKENLIVNAVRLFNGNESIQVIANKVQDIKYPDTLNHLLKYNPEFAKYLSKKFKKN